MLKEINKNTISGFIVSELDEKIIEDRKLSRKKRHLKKYLNVNRSGEIISKLNHNLTSTEIKRIILEYCKSLFTEEEYNYLLNYIYREEANNKLIRGEITPKEYGEMMQEKGNTLNLGKKQG